MQLPERVAKVLSSSGVISTSGFQIDASPLAFRILSSGIYSDKIGAVLREVGCNGTDAHIEVGTPDRPIEVKLPNSLDPMFWVKDWGPGLPDELVRGTAENNYTDGVCVTYFASLKRQCTKQTGHHGLGFKAPYSYTDSFTVVSCHQGVRSTYCAYLNEEELPTMALLGEEPVTEDWPHGIMVGLSVAPRDIAEFARKAQEIYRYFEVTPTILGAEPIRVPEKTLQGSNFFFDKNERKSKILMASVAYPLHIERFAEISDLVQSLVKSGLCLSIPNGSVRPTASREEIEYDDLARKTIPVALQGIPKEVARMVYEQISVPAPTDWEQHAQTQQVVSKLPNGVRSSLKSLLQLLELPEAEMARLKSLCWSDTVRLPEWVGAPEYLPREIDAYASFRENPEPEFVGPPSPRYLPRVLNLKQQLEVWYYERKDDGRITRRRVEKGSIGSGSSTSPVDLKYGTQAEVVTVEKAPHWNGRIRQRMFRENIDTALVVKPLNALSFSAVQPYAKRLSEELGSLPVISAADLRLPESVARRKELAKEAKVKGHKPSVRKLHADVEVDLVDFKTPRTPVRFGSLPEACTNYLCYSERRRYRVFSGTLLGKSSEIDQRKLGDFFTAYRNLAKHGLPLPELPSYIEVKPAVAKKLKLNGNGFTSLLETIGNALQAKAFLKAVQARMSSVPKLGINHEYSARQLGLIPFLAHFQLYRKDEWKLLAPVVGKHPLLAGLVDRVALTHQNQLPEARIRASLDDLMEHVDLQDLLPAPKTGAQVFGSANDLEEAVHAAYPLSRFIDLSDLGNGLVSRERDVERTRRTLVYFEQLLVKSAEYQQFADRLCPLAEVSPELAQAS